MQKLIDWLIDVLDWFCYSPRFQPFPFLWILFIITSVFIAFWIGIIFIGTFNYL